MKTEDAGPDVRRDTGVDPTGDASACALAIRTINGRPADQVAGLSVADDQSEDTGGIQIDVGVVGTGLADGTLVTLSVTLLSPSPQVAASGSSALFQGVTVASTLTEVLISATAPGCSAAQVTLQVIPAPECVFEAPNRDGLTLTSDNDTVPGTDAVDIDVVIATVNASGGEVGLKVNQINVGTQTVDADGKVTFEDATLEDGAVTLTGTLDVGGVTRSCTRTVTVATGRPACSISFTPEPQSVTGGRQGIGVVHDADTGTDGMQAEIEVTTDAAVDRVALKVDGTTQLEVTASAGAAQFNGFALPEGSHTLQAVCFDLDANPPLEGESLEMDLLVDSEAPAAIAAINCTFSDRRGGDISCEWTAVGDQGSGVEVYALRHSTDAEISASTWDAATEEQRTPAQPAGQLQQVALTDLPFGATYHLAVRAVDRVGNMSTVAVPGGSPFDVDFLEQQRQGPDSASDWGRAVASGDFNCDGRSDLAIGEPAWNSERGRVRVFFGQQPGGQPILSTPDRSLSGTTAGANFGAAVAAVGDFDNDGCGDLAVLASEGDTNLARVYLFLGQSTFPNLTDSAADLVLKLDDLAPAGDRLLAIAPAGDFDNDGADDLALTHHDTGANNAAAVWVVHGEAPLVTGTRELPGAAGSVISGGVADEAFGRALCAGPSLKGSAASELLIGVPAMGTGGAVYLVEGGPRATIDVTSSGRATRIDGGSSGSFGSAVAAVGDMDNDAVAEFAVSDPDDAGRVYLFSTQGGDPTALADAVAVVDNDVTNAAGDRFGVALGCAGGDLPLVDVDGDGLGDLIASSETEGASGVGAIFIFRGSGFAATRATSGADHTIHGPAGGASFGRTLTVVEDINQDGYNDLVAGQPQAASGAGSFTLFY